MLFFCLLLLLLFFCYFVVAFFLLLLLFFFEVIFKVNSERERTHHFSKDTAQTPDIHWCRI